MLRLPLLMMIVHVVSSILKSWDKKKLLAQLMRLRQYYARRRYLNSYSIPFEAVEKPCRASVSRVGSMDRVHPPLPTLSEEVSEEYNCKIE